MNAKRTERGTQVRFARFLVVGGGSALVQFAVLAVLKGRVGDTWAFTVSWVISTGAHYLLNRFWALPSGRHDTGQQFGEYLGTAAISYAINLAAFKVCHDFIGLGLIWSSFWAIPPATLVVCLLLNYRVFRAKTTE